MGKSKNDFVLEYQAEQALTTFNFQMTDHSIGNSKDWGGVSVKQKDKQLTITVEANRHGSKTPAEFYKNFVNGDTDHMIHTEKGSNSPDKLNFAVAGVLTINSDTYEICIGQGHYGATNNWHMCSKSIQAQSNNKGGELLADHTPLADQFFLDPSGSHTFKVKNVSQLSGSHDNEFELSLGSGSFEQFDFELESASVTVGQAFKGVEASYKEGTGTITVKAGRHKTKAVAKWFKDELDGGPAIASYTSDKTPDELNFAIKGILTIKVAGTVYKIKDVVIGQGSNIGLQNNWWLGGPSMIGTTVPVLGGGLVMYKQILPPRAVFCKSILSTNEMSLNILNVLGEVSSVDEITPDKLTEQSV
ncbi:MAG: hypothetical protein ACPGJS_02680 [Flammeovirgaceae bacterium]